MKHVSNEEKAKEIAEQSVYLSDFPHDKKSVMYGALEAMKWKDKERKELWRITRNHYQEWAEEQIAKEKQQLIKRTVDWVQKEATKHIGFNAISEECSLSWDFTDLLVKAMKGE